MRRLSGSLAAWGSADFPAVLTAELGALGPRALPLNRLSGTGHPLETGLTCNLIAARDLGESLQATVGVFFEEIVPGCSCGDEPQPQTVYGELSVTIDKGTALALIEPREP